MTIPAEPALDAAARMLIPPTGWADPAMMPALEKLRSHQPFRRVVAPEIAPFLAVTRYRDIVEISSRPEEFLSGPRSFIRSEHSDEARAGARRQPALIEMTGQDHARHRRALQIIMQRVMNRAFASRIGALARSRMTLVATPGPEVEIVSAGIRPFVQDALCLLIGFPDEDQPIIHRFVNEPFDAAGGAMVSLLQRRLPQRQAEPKDDVMSGIAHCRPDQMPFTRLEQISHVLTLLTAGYETSVAALAGGLAQLLASERQQRLFRSGDAPIHGSIDEMLRWTSPVRGFMRIASRSCQVGDNAVETGDALLLVYPAANRDAAIFDRAERFDIGAVRAGHLSFGHGAHRCLGAGLAHIIMDAWLTAFFDRFKQAALMRNPEVSRSPFIGGVNHLMLHLC